MANWKKMAEAFGREMSGVKVPNDPGIDAMTDRDLQKDFTSLFEEAAAKASPELRAQAIEMLQRGESIPDVLDVLNWGD